MISDIAWGMMCFFCGIYNHGIECMKLRTIVLYSMVLFGVLFGGRCMALPAGFVYLRDVDASIIQEM